MPDGNHPAEKPSVTGTTTPDRWDDVCFGPLASCDVDWSAVGAIGTMAATIAALFIAAGREKVRRINETRHRSAILAILVPKLGNVANLMIQANELASSAQTEGWSKDRVASELAILFLNPPTNFDSSLIAPLDQTLTIRVSELAGVLEQLNQHAHRCADARNKWHAQGAMPAHLLQNIGIDCERTAHLVGLIALLMELRPSVDATSIGTMLNAYREDRTWTAASMQEAYQCSLAQLRFALGLWHQCPRDRQAAFAAILRQRIREGMPYDPDLLANFERQS